MTERLSLSKNTQYINWLLPHNSFLPQHIYLYYFIHIFEINSISTSTYTPKLRAAYFWSPIFLTTECLYTGGKKKWKYQLLSHVQLNSATPLTVVYQAPLSMEFTRQEYWSGLPFPSPGDVQDPGVKSRSLTLQADSLPFEPPGKTGIQKESIL